MATTTKDKSMKLQQYAVALTQQAEGEERSGKSEEAIKHYLKLVDVFLVLAAEVEDHNTWLQYICQVKCIKLGRGRLSPANSRVRETQPTIDSTLRESNGDQKSESIQNKLNPLKKILKPFQKSADETPIGPRFSLP